MQFSGAKSDLTNRGSNQSGMRAYNERLVMTLLRRHGPLSKSDIARMTGLTAQTISVIMRSLESEELLQRGEPIRVKGKVGQPSVPISLAPEGALFFGLKLGRRSTDLVLIDFLGTVIDQVHQSYDYPTPVNTKSFALDAMEKIKNKLGPTLQKRIAGLGIGMPFQMWNWVETLGAPKEVMNAWRSVDIRGDLETETSLPVYLQNDATAACGAELVFGQTAGPQSFIYYYIGYFIGGGVVINGSLHTGQQKNAGSFGSMPVPDSNGKSRQLIEIASVATLERMITEKGLPLPDLWGSCESWKIDQAVLDTWIDNTTNAIAYTSLSAMAVLEYESVLIDGWLPESVRSSIVAGVKSKLQTLDFTGIERPEVTEGTVGYNARALGAASLPLSQRFLVEQNSFLKEA